MRLHLTDVAVKRLKPAPTAYWDESTPGFGVRIGRHTKTWVIIRGRDRERTTIGHYPDLSLQEARLEAKKLLLFTPEPKTMSVMTADAREEFAVRCYRTLGRVGLADRHLLSPLSHQTLGG